MVLKVSFTTEDGEQKSMIMDVHDGSFIGIAREEKYALHIPSLRVYKQRGNVICSALQNVSKLTIEVIQR